MADIMSAAARGALPATPRLVDHRRPTHDRLCRCRACKPPVDRDVELRRRAWLAILVLVVTFWATIAYAAFVR